jgi:hypothetical protein
VCVHRRGRIEQRAFGLAVIPKSRLTQAVVAYAALSVAAYFILSGTPLRVVLILFGYFMVRMLIEHFRPKD